MRARTGLLLAALALAVAACAEKPQTAETRKSDSKPSDGTANAAFTAGGWKSGDHASWEEQMRIRAQGQNEYSRAAAQ